MADPVDIFETTAALIEIKEREVQWNERIEEAKQEAEKIISEARAKVRELENILIQQAVDEAKKKFGENVLKAEEESQVIVLQAEDKCKQDRKRAAKRLEKAVTFLVEKVAG